MSGDQWAGINGWGSMGWEQWDVINGQAVITGQGTMSGDPWMGNTGASLDTCSSYNVLLSSTRDVLFTPCLVWITSEIHTSPVHDESGTSVHHTIILQKPPVV